MSKKWIVPIVKAGLLTGIFYWLISSGKLNIQDLSKYKTDPKLILYLVSTWIISFIFIAAYRLKVICGALDIKKSFLNMVNLHMIGTFFNVAMPGSVGGDFIKGFYLYKEDESTTKTTAFLCIFLDRLSGLLGLFILGFGCFMFLTDDPFSHKQILPLVLFVSIFFVGSLGVVGLFFFGGEKIINWFQSKVNFLAKLDLLNQLKVASKALSKKPQTFLTALLLSMIIQGSNMLFFFYICTKFSSDVTFAQVALVFPLGVLISAIPLAPGGLGVGHAAFEKLFTMLGIQEGVGANAFNLHVVGFIACFCVGGIPYLLNRKKIKKDMQTEDAIS